MSKIQLGIWIAASRSILPHSFLLLLTMARRGLVPAVVGAGATALLASSGPSFAVPRAADATKAKVQGVAASYAADAAPTPLGFATVASAAVAAAGLAAARRGSRVAASRADTSHVVCAAGSVGKKRCLVMGGTRFIGCYLVAKLREQGHDVVVCNRGKTNGGKPEPLPGVPWILLSKVCG